jgi:KUP system potassium uptake protein
LDITKRSGVDAAPAGSPPPDAEKSIPAAAPVVHSHAHAAHGADLGKLALGALGVVYGDIGTSPLYAVKECVTLPHGVSAVPENILGVLSLIFWAITLVVSV